MIPQIIKGGLSVDDRGMLTFINELNLRKIRRFYMVENFSIETVRAFHGHLVEEKFIFVASGAAIVIAVKIEGPGKLSGSMERFVLSAKVPQVLHIPCGFANGFRALEDGTRILFFSTASLTESLSDDYRFPADAFGEDIWKVKAR